MIYTTGWTREKLQTPQQYADWLATLKDGDMVARQEFVPPANILGMPFERWRFTKGHVTGLGTDSWRFHDAPDSSPVRPDGVSCWWGNDREWGEVFPARLVPMHYDLQLDNLKPGHWVYGHAPVYEPEFFDCFRHVFFVPYGKDIHKRECSLREAFPRHYRTDAEDGYVYVCFSANEFEGSIDGVRFCYSQYLKP